MTYDYRCPCGWTGEVNVRLESRDRLPCPECGELAKRLPHYAHVKVWIPFYMRAGHDEREYLPDEPEERAEFQAEAFRQHGRRRTDLETVTETRFARRKPKGERAYEKDLARPRKTPRQVIDEVAGEFRAAGKPI